MSDPSLTEMEAVQAKQREAIDKKERFKMYLAHYKVCHFFSRNY